MFVSCENERPSGSHSYDLRALTVAYSCKFKKMIIFIMFVYIIAIASQCDMNVITIDCYVFINIPSSRKLRQKKIPIPSVLWKNVLVS